MSKEENMVIYLLGQNYLVVDFLIGRESTEKKIVALSKRYDCIFKGVKEVNNGGWWSRSCIIVQILVPEKNIMEFNKESIHL